MLCVYISHDPRGELMQKHVVMFTWKLCVCTFFTVCFGTKQPRHSIWKSRLTDFCCWWKSDHVWLSCITLVSGQSCSSMSFKPTKLTHSIFQLPTFGILIHLTVQPNMMIKQWMPKLWILQQLSMHPWGLPECVRSDLVMYFEVTVRTNWQF